MIAMSRGVLAGVLPEDLISRLDTVLQLAPREAVEAFEPLETLGAVEILVTGRLCPPLPPRGRGRAPRHRAPRGAGWGEENFGAAGTPWCLGDLGDRWALPAADPAGARR